MFNKYVFVTYTTSRSMIGVRCTGLIAYIHLKLHSILVIYVSF